MANDPTVTGAVINFLFGIAGVLLIGALRALHRVVRKLKSMLTHYLNRLGATGHGHKLTSNIRTSVVKHPTYPTLLLARRMIVQAFHDAMQCRNGKPTEQALEAFDWLNGRTDWTLSGNDLIPPENLRQEFYGTFEWACRWLEEKPDHVRTHGLANVCGMGFTGGLRTVMSAWEAAEEKIGDISLSVGAALPRTAVDSVCQKSS